MPVVKPRTLLCFLKISLCFRSKVLLTGELHSLRLVVDDSLIIERMGRKSKHAADESYFGLHALMQFVSWSELSTRLEQSILSRPCSMMSIESKVMILIFIAFFLLIDVIFLIDDSEALSLESSALANLRICKAFLSSSIPSLRIPMNAWSVSGSAYFMILCKRLISLDSASRIGSKWLKKLEKCLQSFIVSSVSKNLAK